MLAICVRAGVAGSPVAILGRESVVLAGQGIQRRLGGLVCGQRRVQLTNCWVAWLRFFEAAQRQPSAFRIAQLQAEAAEDQQHIGVVRVRFKRCVRKVGGGGIVCAGALQLHQVQHCVQILRRNLQRCMKLLCRTGAIAGLIHCHAQLVMQAGLIRCQLHCACQRRNGSGCVALRQQRGAQRGMPGGQVGQRQRQAGEGFNGGGVVATINALLAKRQHLHQLRLQVAGGGCLWLARCGCGLQVCQGRVPGRNRSEALQAQLHAFKVIQLQAQV